MYLSEVAGGALFSRKGKEETGDTKKGKRKTTKQEE